MVNNCPYVIDITSQYNFNSTWDIIKSTKSCLSDNRIYQDQIKAGQEVNAMKSYPAQHDNHLVHRILIVVVGCTKMVPMVITSSLGKWSLRKISLHHLLPTLPSSAAWPARKIAGVTVGLFALICLIATEEFCVWRQEHERRQKSAGTSSQAGKDDNIGFGTQEEFHNECGKLKLPGESRVWELNGDVAPAEILGENGREALQREA
ncbi:hypothetical protein BJ875DRAFT_442829 [Amylocarpus encephaloides]|uniref:Uncharacterized protein n=1 Tax=Amylocarpus encephaloides TaxID=45428 RepID=A0A9P7YFI3_9HELO|nr:hypothetical protein BJ875DRAFT_442829 [Amylocarpus encephaloides]